VRSIIAGALVGTVMAGVASAQVPTGMVAGIVHDPSSAVMTGAQVEAVSRATGQSRTTISGEHGEYSFPALLPGDYDISVEAAGFQRTVRTATVAVGTTTTTDFTLRVGDISDAITVAAASPQMHYDSATVSGLTTRAQIDGLPLNGRSFLELAKLEPGVRPPTPGNLNRTLVPVLEAPAGNLNGARFTVDGGSVTAVAFAGSQIALSQEVVQEFQVSTVNPDLSTGLSVAGAINVVTRSGGNAPAGTAFSFFRDHTLAAYPALSRDPLNPDPFFRRVQFGGAVGGPLVRDRVFAFGSWERNDQRSVAETTLRGPDFASLSRVTSSPFVGDLLSLRVDAKLTTAHSAFVRYSRDSSGAFGPQLYLSAANASPSDWFRATTSANQSLVGLTSVLGATMVNDLRVSYFLLDARLAPPRPQDCPACLGLGAPLISVPQPGLTIGSSASNDTRDNRFHVNDSLTWQRARHRVRVGVDWERNGDLILGQPNALKMTLFSPDQVRVYNALQDTPANLSIPLPATFLTLDDILQLPLQSMALTTGDLGAPQEGGGAVRRWNTLWLYAEDAWQLHERVTVNYGLGWGVDGNLNHDLWKPPLLAPLLGADGLGPTRINWTNFSPMGGVAWTPAADRKTVVRAGAGRFYAPQALTGSMNAERVALGPPGLGLTTIMGSGILNPLPGIPGVPVTRPLDFPVTPTRFTGADLLAILSTLQAAQIQKLASGDPTVQAIQLTKQMPQPAIFPAHVPNPSAVHASVGVQREIGRGLVISADLVYRHFTHEPTNGGAFDVNHFNSSRGPVIPRCTTDAQRNDPQAMCSTGPINVQEAPHYYTYKGLLVRADKRLSQGFQVLGSYAYASNTGANASAGFNLDNWLQNIGPTGDDRRHVLNIAGMKRLPWQVDLGFNVSYTSAPPFSAFVGGIDFNGDGTKGDLLPGTTVNAFNRGMGPADLERLVTQFNQTYAGTKDAQGTLIPTLRLPAHYSLGSNFHTLDLRVTRLFVIDGRWSASLIGEVFNLYNKANLSGYSGDLTNSATFGQPTSRAAQIFGSGGPRAFQLAARMNF